MILDVLELKNELGPKYVIFMVGLPARGKSYICKKLTRYLTWCGFNCKIFNVGNRRRVHGEADSSPASVTKQVENPSSTHPITTQHDANFFESSNTEAATLREKLAGETLEELIQWLHDGGKVAIHDATNSTIARRKFLIERVRRETGIKALFIESICPDKELLEQNIKMKLQGPDYINVDPEVAIRDFKKRILNYEKVYQTIDEEEEKQNVSYIKIVNVGNKVIAHQIRGYLPSQCVFYLMQMNIVKRTIWLTRHGESVYNTVGRIGGDPQLSAIGKDYSTALLNFMEKNQESLQSEPLNNYEKLNDSMCSLFQSRPILRVLTSTLQRAIDTVEPFYSCPEHYEVHTVKFLNEIYSGSFEEMTYDEIMSKYPKEFEERKANKLLYRYPGTGGESIVDVIERLRPVIVELERMRKDVLVVTHQVVMRTLLAYFTGCPLQDVPKVDVPLHTLYKLEPKPYGADLKRYVYNPQTKEIEYAGDGMQMLSA
ncbi:6-phosphofructo-2-kinase-domain-containing protein [Globomyces pollinis-pini]|nr:6-phosphofructo-2-kinase-domain-containing protein [Globomyces pollinis-pini]